MMREFSVIHKALAAVFVAFLTFAANTWADSGELNPAYIEFCEKSFANTKICPERLCEQACPGDAKTQGCDQKICVPKDCRTFGQDDCPRAYCVVVKDCTLTNHCLSRPSDNVIPDCVRLGEYPKFAECCPGMVPRCGFDYLDGKCNMGGRNTPYLFPICIRCGDGVCTNFENHCNCPEDCKKDIIPLN